MRLHLIASPLLFLALAAQAVPSQIGSFLPENDLHLQKNTISNDMTEEDFNQIIDAVAKLYNPVIESFGAKLIMHHNWSDNTVNAYASQSDDEWHVQMFGGLARRNEVTHDGFALVVCHELGHHLAGVPFYPSWAASEGQSDYFATIACAKQIWANDDERNSKARTAILAANQGSYAKRNCDNAFNDTADQNLCYRSMLGGQSLAGLLAALGNHRKPQFNTPDSTTVKKTQMSHPAAQCRLDTYMAGATCAISWEAFHIPGKNYADRRSLLAYLDAKPFACQRYEKPLGARPLCWFAPDDITRPKVTFSESSQEAVIERDETHVFATVSGQRDDTVVVAMTGDGDADLYVRMNAAPTQDEFDCRPFRFGSKETCRLKIKKNETTIETMAIGWSQRSQITVTMGIETTARLCRNFGGGQGEAFPCWDDYSCKLISSDENSQRNWCIDY